MMSFVRKMTVAALLILPGAACGQEQTPAALNSVDDGRHREALTITSKNTDGEDAIQSFMVELAVTPADQTQGLMYRETMGERQGMLFVFTGSRLHNFWMKNTLIPLDIIFIRADGTIARIAERTVPLSEALIGSRVPVRSVLELNGGGAERFGIEIGDTVSHPLIDNQ